MKPVYATQKFPRLGLLCLLFATSLMLPAQAAVVDIAKAPLFSMTTSAVKPNLMLILDNSGSMGDDFLPDEASGTTTFGFKSPQCNGLAFNPDPTIKYTVPVDSSGADLTPLPSFTSAWTNGFNQSSSKTDLSSASNNYYYAYVGTETPLSYTYNTNGVIKTNFYNECHATATATPHATIKVTGSGATVVSSIKVNGVEIMSGSSDTNTTNQNVAANIAAKITQNSFSASSAMVNSIYTITITGPDTAASFLPVVTQTGGMSIAPTAFSPFVKTTVTAADQQNYANWYSYYRIRLLMMKSAVGLAFKSVTSNFRVGFNTISYTGTTDTANLFLHIADFASGPGSQKEKFYSSLYGSSANGYTPLRGALSKVGRIFAGVQGSAAQDPMQYSCQQNFTLLSTDGYWNTAAENGSYGPFGLTGNPVGEQDGIGTPKPMWDGGQGTVTQTTPIVQKTKVTTPKTVVVVSTRTITTGTTTTKTQTDTYTRTRITTANSSCSNGKKKVTTTNYSGSNVETETKGTSSVQTQTKTDTTNSNDVTTTTSTKIHKVVTTNGVQTSDTTSNAVDVPTGPVNTVTSTSTDDWANTGTPAPGESGPTTTFSPAKTIAGISWTVTSSNTTGCISPPSQSDTMSGGTGGGWSGDTTVDTGPTTLVTGTAPTTTTGTAVTEVGAWVTGDTTTTTVNTSGNYNSLADVAMYYYQNDLRYPARCTSGSTGANLCPFVVDNDGKNVYTPNVPGTGNDGNKHPHMTTFTLGLGVNGLLKYSPTYANTSNTAGDFPFIISGTKNGNPFGWPDPATTTTSPYGDTSNSVIERIDDLWHAAVNGRGVYFSAKNPKSLVSSLNAALAGMSARLGYGTSAATSNLSPISGDNALYVASYTTADWFGNLVAQSIDPLTGMVNQHADWCVTDVVVTDADTQAKTTLCHGKLASQVAPSDARKIYFNKSGTLTELAFITLPIAQQAWFNPQQLSQWSSSYVDDDKIAATGSKTGTDGTTLVNYLRGQTPMNAITVPASPTPLYRTRIALLGDIVDTPPVFLSKPTFDFADLGYNTWKNLPAQQDRAKTIFVGANDGMLHAFDAIPATGGKERWAFIPTPVMPNMHWLADANYTTNHRNFVDGKTNISDVCVAHCDNADTAEWHSILIGGLNGGGRGYYAIDITVPTNPKLLWEFTSINDADLGYSFGNPLAAKKADGTWVVIVNSGYDNVQLGSPTTLDAFDTDGSGGGFVFVLDPMDGRVITKIPTGVGSKTTPSGLGKLVFWADSPNTDATALNVYGGDLLGNLWRFNINTSEVILLATFKDGSGNVQPITTRPELANVNGSRVIYVSTGKYLEASDLDPAGFKTQSVYAMVDTGAPMVNPPRTTLIKQTLTNAGATRTVTTIPVNIPSDKGWFVDLPDSGERSNVDMILAQGTLLVPTNVPTNGICEAGGYSWLNFFNYKTGSLVPGAKIAGISSGNDLTTGINLVLINGQPVVIRTGTNSSPQLLPGPVFNPGSATGVTGHHVSWREIISK